MSTIQEEYARLQTFSRVDWKKVDVAWLNICDFARDSKGSSVEGITIDTETKQVFCGTINHHLWSYEKLQNHLEQYEPGITEDDMTWRIIKGWRGTILDFRNPCVYLDTSRLFHDLELFKEIEESILTQGIGLPLNRLYLQKIKVH